MKLLDRIDLRVNGDASIDVMIMGRDSFIQLISELGTREGRRIDESEVSELMGMEISVNLNKDQGFSLARVIETAQ